MHRLLRPLTTLAALLLAVAPALAAPARAPDFTGISHWINSRPLHIKDLRGKVVLVDFWTYSCINCLRSLPYVKRWYAKYHDKGFVVVGVHSPEFDFEKKQANVEQAVRRLGITYPVAQDNDLDTWNAWDNQYWPAEYLIDQHGNVVLHHYGEGHYGEMEHAIRRLLALGPMHGSEPAGPDFAGIRSPEMYFGSERVQNMANPIVPLMFSHDYQWPEQIGLNRFALEGRWRLSGQYAELTGDRGRIRLRFNAGKVHMVASSAQPVTLSISVDGKPQPPVTVHGSRLYTLFDSHDYRQHVLTVTIPQHGFRAFTFTFG